MVVKITLFVCSMLVPLTMIGFGYYFYRHAPKEINDIFGYRTSMSMLNEDTWQFAHHYAGYLWLNWGIALLVFTIIFMLWVFQMDEERMSIMSTIFMCIQIIPLIAAIIPTEKALRKTFDKEGNRK